ncbi:hypothetical protein ACOSP7_007361 [Xanthoceras sorbifolium]
MELSFEENIFLSNKVDAVDCSGDGGGDTKLEGSRVICSEIKCGKQIDCVIEAANMVYNMRNEKLTNREREREREIIDYCEKKVMKRFGYRYAVRDMVWGKVRSHPWCAGQIYNEAFALPCARNAMREGRVLVSFFGDTSCGWFDPIELIQFDINYIEKSKQTNDMAFISVVQEAEDEACRRAALGLLCHCRNPTNFRATGLKGFVEVDVYGYPPSGLYSMKQIESARDGNMKRSIKWIQNMAIVLTYRKTVFEEVDETYIQAIGVQTICSTDSNCALDLHEQLHSQEGSFFCFSNHKKSALTAGGHVVQRRGSPACIITESKVGSINTTPGPSHSGKEATTLKKKSVPEKFSSIKAVVNREAMRVENCDVSEDFKQFQPRFSKVAKTSHHLKNVKMFGRTAPPSDVVLHGKVLVKNGDSLDEKPAPKCLGEELQFEELATISKKKRKKELGLEYPHNHLKNIKEESSNGTTNSVSSKFVATEQMVDRRSNSSKISRLVGFLLALALNPFHGEQHDIPAFKHFVLAPAELLEGPLSKSPTFDVDAMKSPYNWTAQDLPSSSKPPKKRLKLLDYENVGPNRISNCGKGASIEELKELKDLKSLAAKKKAGDEKLVKSLGRNERKTNVTALNKLTKYSSKKSDTPTRATKPTMILMQFPHSHALGILIPSAPRVFWKSSTCQVVFKYKSDAMAAYSYAVESKSLFGSVKVEYCLQALEVPATQFPNPCKEIAGKALDEVSPFKPFSTSDYAKPRPMAPRHQLLHPRVQPRSCLKKQLSNELDSTDVVHGKTPHLKVMNSNGGSSSYAAININAKNSPLLLVPPNQKSYVNENCKSDHLVEICNAHYLQLEARNNRVCTTTTNTETIDISAQMLSLLMRCS